MDLRSEPLGSAVTDVSAAVVVLPAVFVGVALVAVLILFVIDAVAG